MLFYFPVPSDYQVMSSVFYGGAVCYTDGGDWSSAESCRILQHRQRTVSNNLFLLGGFGKLHRYMMNKLVVELNNYLAAYPLNKFLETM